MISRSSLGNEYWDCATRYAEIILKKMSFGRDGISPWEKLTSRETSVKAIRRFGEPCFVQIPKQIREKSTFEIDKAVRGTIMGQDENVSG